MLGVEAVLAAITAERRVGQTVPVQLPGAWVQPVTLYVAALATPAPTNNTTTATTTMTNPARSFNVFSWSRA